MALIHINADLRDTNKLLSRIATTLDRICTHWCGVPLADPPPAADPRRLDDELSYTDDLTEARRELEKAAGVARGEPDQPSADDNEDAT